MEPSLYSRSFRFVQKWNPFTLLLLAGILFFSTLVTGQSLTNVLADSILTNKAMIFQPTYTSMTDIEMIEVKSNYGGEFTRDLTDASGFAGQLVYFTNIFQNKGNHTDVFRFYLTYTNYQNSVITSWSNWMETLSGLRFTNATLASGGFLTNRLVFRIPSTANGGALVTFRLVAKILDVNATTNYVGANLLTYGGSLGRGPDGAGFVNTPFPYAHTLEVNNTGPFYVDDDSGNDSNSGTFLFPFRTIQKAVDRMAPGVNVTSATTYVFPGRYTEAVLARSNRNLGWMTISGLSNGKLPVIDGENVRNYGLRLENMRRITLRGMEIKCSQNGAILYNVTNSRFETSVFRSNSINGILLEWFDRGSVSNLFAGCLFKSNQTSFNHGPWNSRGNTFWSNRVHCGNGQVAIGGWAANDFLIGKNTFEGYANSTWGGLQFQDQWLQTKITNNIFRNFMCGLAFFNTSSNPYVTGNSFTNCNAGIHISGSTWGLYSGNRFRGVDWQSFIIQSGSSWNRFVGNDLQNNSQGFDVYPGATNNEYRNNQIKGFSSLGFRIKGRNSLVVGNQLLTNTGLVPGIECLSNARGSVIVSNKVVSMGGHGIRIQNVSVSTLRQNAVFHCLGSGIEMVFATNCRVYNNSIVSNNLQGINVGQYSGILIVNNIMAYNGGRGVFVSNVNSHVTNRYNLFYGNFSGTYGGPLSFENNNLTNDLPELLTYNHSSNMFLKPATNSPCIDAGTDVGLAFLNLAPDLGWMETAFSVYRGPFYVDDSTGNDNNIGSFPLPFRTIQKAMDRMSAARNVTVSTTYVFPGYYDERVLVRSNKNIGFMTIANLSNRLPRMHGDVSRSSAFLITNVRRLVVRGVVATNYTNAVQLYSCRTNRFYQNRFITNKRALFLSSSSECLFVSNLFRRNETGFDISFSPRNRFLRNTLVSNSSVGLVLAESYSNLIQGNMFRNSPGTGINLSWHAMSTVIQSNTFLRLFWPMSVATYASNTVIRWNRFSAQNTSTWGINIGSFVNGLLVSSNTFQSNQSPQFFMGGTQSKNVSIVDNEYLDGAASIELTEVSNLMVSGNRFARNSGRAIMMRSGIRSAEIRGNSFVTNSSRGISAENVTNLIVVRNTFFSNQPTGVFLTNTSGIVIRSNLFNGSLTNGMFVKVSFSNTYANNRFNRNAHYGLRLISDVGSVICSNTFFRITNGIHLLTSRGTILRQNRIASNVYPLTLDGSRETLIVSNAILDWKEQGVRLINNSSANRVLANRIREISVPNYANYCGIYGSAYSNSIHQNILSNCNFGMNLNFGSKYSVVSNRIQGGWGTPVYLLSLSQSLISNNRIERNSATAIELWGSASNRFMNNEIVRNSGVGILMNGGGGNSPWTLIRNNQVYSNTSHGILAQSPDNVVLNNAIARNAGSGIYVVGAHNLVRNNTVFSNVADGIWFDAVATSSTCRNNIVTGNAFGSGSGIRNSAADVSFLTYNDVWQNASFGNSSQIPGAGNYSVNCTPGMGSLSQNPLLAETTLFGTLGFLGLSAGSPAIDAGAPMDSPYIGVRIDMGWLEFAGPYVQLSISKSVSNILGPSGPLLRPMPGSLVYYKLEISLITNLVQGTNLIVQDKIPRNTCFVTNLMGTVTGWTIQYSTNASPSQVFGSGDYTDAVPANKCAIKWVRWRKGKSGQFVDGTLVYNLLVR